MVLGRRNYNEQEERSFQNRKPRSCPKCGNVNYGGCPDCKIYFDSPLNGYDGPTYNNQINNYSSQGYAQRNGPMNGYNGAPNYPSMGNYSFIHQQNHGRMGNLMNMGNSINHLPTVPPKTRSVGSGIIREANNKAANIDYNVNINEAVKDVMNKIQSNSSSSTAPKRQKGGMSQMKGSGFVNMDTFFSNELLGSQLPPKNSQNVGANDLHFDFERFDNRAQQQHQHQQQQQSRQQQQQNRSNPLMREHGSNLYLSLQPQGYYHNNNQNVGGNPQRSNNRPIQNQSRWTPANGQRPPRPENYSSIPGHMVSQSNMSQNGNYGQSRIYNMYQHDNMPERGNPNGMMQQQHHEVDGLYSPHLADSESHMSDINQNAHYYGQHGSQQQQQFGTNSFHNFTEHQKNPKFQYRQNYNAQDRMDYYRKKAENAVPMTASTLSKQYHQLNSGYNARPKNFQNEARIREISSEQTPLHLLAKPPKKNKEKSVSMYKPTSTSAVRKRRSHIIDDDDINLISQKNEHLTSKRGRKKNSISQGLDLSLSKTERGPYKARQVMTPDKWKALFNFKPLTTYTDTRDLTKKLFSNHNETGSN